MKNRFGIFFLGSGVFLFFVFFSYLVHKDLFTQADFDTTVRLQDNISRRFDGPFSLLSDIGSFEPMLILLIILLLLRRKILGIIAFGLFGTLHLIELYGKFFVQHPPPPQFMIRTQDLAAFPQFYIRSEFSYPSGHAARAAFLTALLGMFILSSKLTRTKKIVLLFILVCYDIAMLLTRVYLGEHWASDVIGGAMLGLSLGLISGVFVMPGEALSHKEK